MTVRFRFSKNVIAAVLLFTIGASAAGPGGLIDIQKMLTTQEVPSLGGLDLSSASERTSIGKSFVDNAIDEDSYFIGMGDVFSITVLEMPSVAITAQVNQNCDVYITQFGLLKLGKMPLRKAKERIAAFVKENMRSNNVVYVSLKEGKKASIAVNGAVTVSGTSINDGVMRIWDCMLKANKSEKFLFEEVDLRDVTLERIDTTLHLDMMKYIFKNDIRENPYIYPGDRIYVSPASRRVYLEGELSKPLSGFFPIRQGETLADLLTVIALNDAADSNYIVVQQGRSIATRKEMVVSFANAATVTLENMDMITFSRKKDYPRIISVTISGAVARPGIYPCIHNKTTADDIIKLAGGYLEQADTNRISVLRDFKMAEVSKDEKTDKMKVETSWLNNQGSVRPEINTSLIRLVNSKDFTVVPFSSEKPVVIEDGDEIVIPYAEPLVYVSGCVNRPGAYAFVDGKERNYYVKLAGGYTSKSDRGNTYTLTHIKGVVQMRDGKRVGQGDIVVVPDSQNNKTLTTLLLPFLQIISTGVTVIIAVVTLRG